MKAIEEERDALLKGLQTVEKAEQWYRDQLAAVQVGMYFNSTLVIVVK